MIRRSTAIGSAILVALLLAGCKSGPSKDPLLNLSAGESLVQGKQFMAKKKYSEARKYFTHAFEAEPNSAAGREGLLLAADTLYLDGSSTELIQAEAKYRDFQNRFPTSDRAAYVQFQIAKSLAQRIERPDRDQSVAQKALDAFRDLKRLYPTSEYATQADAEIRAVKQSLAEHEFMVGYFYLRYGLPGASVRRFDNVLHQYPEYEQRDKILYWLGVSYERIRQADKAAETFAKLRADYPKSPFVQKIPASQEKASREKPSQEKPSQEKKG